MLDVIDYYEVIFKNRKRSARPKESTEEAKIYSVLDIGCGLGHLYDYSKNYLYKLDYTGLDVSDVFIERCKKKYPEVEFIQRDILKAEKPESEKYDFVIMNGVFTEKLDLDYDTMWGVFTNMLKTAFAYCRDGMADTDSHKKF